MPHRTTAYDASRWMDRGTCALYSLDLNTSDAIAAAHSIGVGTLSARSLLKRFDRTTIREALQRLAECREDECPVHGDVYESCQARTELVAALGEP